MKRPSSSSPSPSAPSSLSAPSICNKNTANYHFKNDTRPAAAKTKNLTLLSNAKTTFLNRVSDGISYLVLRHGYSQSRATDVILNELRKDDPLPSDDEVFRAMQKHGFGMDDATKAIIISKALSKQLKSHHNMEPSQAIDCLTSNLTTMKLLGKIERSSSRSSVKSQGQNNIRQGLQSSNGVKQHISSQSNLLSLSSSSSKKNDLPRTLSWQSTQSINDKSNESSSPPSPTVVEQIPKQNHKKRSNKSSSTTSIHKPLKKSKQNNSSTSLTSSNRKDLSSSTTSSSSSSSSSPKDVDVAVQVAQKVILQKTASVGGKNDINNSNLNTSSSTSTPTRPTTASPRLTRGNNKRDLEAIVQSSSSSQQVTKRQRLDSI